MRTWFLVFAGLFVSGVWQAAPAADKPNFIVLLADDQRADSISALGNSVIKTPNIDSLFETGFRFSQAYCMGSMGGAVCVPSRAMLNSGRYLFNVKTNLSNAPLLPEVLRQNGYVTFATGKWHNGTASFLRGFRQGKAVFFGGMSDHTKVPVVDVVDGKVVNKRIGAKFSSTLFVDAAIEFLQNHDGKKPFYLYVPFTAPHDPRQAPKGYIDRYSAKEVPLPKNFLPQHPFNNGWLVLRDENLAPWPRTEKVIRDQIAEYYGLISHLDHEIGRLLKVLRDSKFGNNTVVIYSADHGLALGSHGLLGKQSLYEHSMKSPLVFAGPGIPRNKSSNALVYLLDIFPTICELAGVPVPKGVDGQSLAPIWRGQKDAIRDSLFLAFSDDMRAVRDERYKLIGYPQINRWQLFDLQKDPDETRDVIRDHRYVAIADRLLRSLVAWQKRVGDRQPLSSEKPMPAEIDLTGRPRKPDQHQPAWIVEKYFKNQ